MTNRIPSAAVAYAIAEERAIWRGHGSTRADDQAMTVGHALDRLARNLSISLHPDNRADFLKRAGVES